MAYFHTTVLDNQIKALPTVDTASGSVATFETDMTEDLIEIVCDIQYQQASGTPSPSNPLPITTYTSLNLSHSGADTSNPTIINIPFGQTVAKGTLNVTTGVLTVTHGYLLVDGSKSVVSVAQSGGTYYTVVNNSDISSYNTSATHLIVSNRFVSGTALVYGNAYITGGGTTLVAVLEQTITTKEQANTYFTNNNAQFIYELLNPITIQLSATQVTALLNENNIWCDTNGDTSVKYILSVGKAIS